MRQVSEFQQQVDLAFRALLEGRSGALTVDQTMRLYRRAHAYVVEFNKAYNAEQRERAAQKKE